MNNNIPDDGKEKNKNKINRATEIDLDKAVQEIRVLRIYGEPIMQFY